MKDPIVEEVRRVRHEHERRCGMDIDAILADLRLHQASSGRKLVRLKPKRTVRPEIVGRAL